MKNIDIFRTITFLKRPRKRNKKETFNKNQKYKEESLARREVNNECSQPAKAFRYKSWKLTKSIEIKLRMAQTAMERIIP